MLIDCPTCSSTYVVQREALGERGRSLICPRCEACWLVGSDGKPRRAPTLGPPVSKGLLRRIAIRLPLRRMMIAAGGCVALVATIALGIGAVRARAEIVGAVPRLAALYRLAGLSVNVRGLVFAGVTPLRREPWSADVTVAVEIRSIARRRVSVPRLAYEVKDASGATVVAWSEAPPQAALAAGRMLRVRSTPHVLPPESRSILVRFD